MNYFFSCYKTKYINKIIHGTARRKKTSLKTYFNEIPIKVKFY